MVHSVRAQRSRAEDTDRSPATDQRRHSPPPIPATPAPRAPAFHLHHAPRLCMTLGDGPQRPRAAKPSRGHGPQPSKQPHNRTVATTRVQWQYGEFTLLHKSEAKVLREGGRGESSESRKMNIEASF